MMISNCSTRNTDYKALQGNTCICLYILVWISYSRPPLYNQQYYINKQPKGQSKKDNPEKMAKQGTQDEEKQKHNTICFGHHYKQ